MIVDVGRCPERKSVRPRAPNPIARELSRGARSASDELRRFRSLDAGSSESSADRAPVGA
ncbi:hypothetical protein TYRP_007107 [Tyrophagus putrescentiae]|nr:hypothetical protein TYRP_007107 [Tyrophagus putrescentiae]